MSCPHCGGSLEHGGDDALADAIVESTETMAEAEAEHDDEVTERNEDDNDTAERIAEIDAAARVDVAEAEAAAAVAIAEADAAADVAIAEAEVDAIVAAADDGGADAGADSVDGDGVELTPVDESGELLVDQVDEGDVVSVEIPPQIHEPEPSMAGASRPRRSSFGRGRRR